MENIEVIYSFLLNNQDEFGKWCAKNGFTPQDSVDCVKWAEAEAKKAEEKTIKNQTIDWGSYEL
jgi:hypothetical protein